MPAEVLANDPHYQRHGIDEVAGTGVIRETIEISCTQQRLHGTTIFRATVKVKLKSGFSLFKAETRTPAPELMLHARGLSIGRPILQVCYSGRNRVRVTVRG